MIDKSKQYRTRDGREVRIYATDGGGEYLVHGATKMKGKWYHDCWTANGVSVTGDKEYDTDLIEVKPRIKREVWVNVYPVCLCHDIAWHTRKGADDGAESDRIACVRLTIDCEEGEGL